MGHPWIGNSCAPIIGRILSAYPNELLVCNTNPAVTFISNRLCSHFGPLDVHILSQFNIMEVSVNVCSFCDGDGQLSFKKLVGDLPPIIMVRCPNCKGRGKVLIQIIQDYGY